MKRDEALRLSQLKVGILLVVGFLILLWVAFNSEIPFLFKGKETLVARFPNADGLLAGAPVMFLGIQTGEVESVEFDPAGAAEPIRVTFTVGDEVGRQLRADASAEIASVSFLGEKHLDVARGEATRPLPKDGVLHGRSETELADLIEPGRRSLARVDSLLVDLEAISGGLREGEGSLGKLLNEDELHQRLLGTLEETQATLVDFRRTQEAVAARLGRAAGSFASAAGSFDSLAAGWRRGRGTLNRLAEDPALYENLNAASLSLNAVSARLERVLATLEREDGLLARMLKEPEFADQVTGLVVDLRALLVDMREHPGRYVQFSLF